MGPYKPLLLGLMSLSPTIGKQWEFRLSGRSFNHCNETVSPGLWWWGQTVETKRNYTKSEFLHSSENWELNDPIAHMWCQPPRSDALTTHPNRGASATIGSETAMVGSIRIPTIQTHTAAVKPKLQESQKWPFKCVFAYCYTKKIIYIYILVVYKLYMYICSSMLRSHGVTIISYKTLGILAHRTSEDDEGVYFITETKRKVFRFHETILRR